MEFKPHFNPSTIGFNEKLGFMDVSAADVALDSLRLLAFATPIDPEGGFTRNNFVTPITRFDDLPEDARTIAAQGKGVGPRMYNTREAFGGAATKPDFIGVYTFDIHEKYLLDMRAKQGNKVAQIGRHAGRMLRAKLGGVEAVVQDIHDSYAKVRNDGQTIDAVELNMPPLPKLRQARHGVENPIGLTPAFMIVRNPAIRLTKVGETDAPW